MLPPLKILRLHLIPVPPQANSPHFQITLLPKPPYHPLVTLWTIPLAPIALQQPHLPYLGRLRFALPFQGYH